MLVCVCMPVCEVVYAFPLLPNVFDARGRNKGNSYEEPSRDVVALWQLVRLLVELDRAGPGNSGYKPSEIRYRLARAKLPAGSGGTVARSIFDIFSRVTRVASRESCIYIAFLSK